MKSTAGMTLLEVLIAIVVLAVGVLAAAAMQTNALSATNDARAIQSVTETAEREIELRRQIDYSVSSADRRTACKSVSEEELTAAAQTCVVEVRTCGLSGVALSCPMGSVATPLAEQITVTITDTSPRARTITLKTVKSR